MNPNDTRFRRALPGLLPVGNAPTTPLEVMTVTYDGLNHVVKKQTGAACVNGIDKWWVEMTCGKKLVVAMGAVQPRETTCLVCMMGG